MLASSPRSRMDPAGSGAPPPPKELGGRAARSGGAAEACGSRPVAGSGDMMFWNYLQIKVCSFFFGEMNAVYIVCHLLQYESLLYLLKLGRATIRIIMTIVVMERRMCYQKYSSAFTRKSLLYRKS